MEESPSAFSVTADSDTQLNYLDKRVMRIDAPHWLPPEQVADLYSVSEWSVSVIVNSDESILSGLNGTHEYTFKAGKSTLVNEADGEETIIDTSDFVGWESVVDGITGKRYFDETENAYIDGSIGTFQLVKTVAVEIDGFNYFASLNVSCEITGPKPMIYVEDEEIQPVWIIGVTFKGDLRSWFEFDPVPETPQLETAVGTYEDKSGEAYEIGTVDSLEPINDSSILITLSAASFHDSFHPL